MPKFKKGERVWYVPDHADGPEHRDAEAGVVKREADPNTYFFSDRPDVNAYMVDYPNDGSGVAKLTYERHLQKRDT